MVAFMVTLHEHQHVQPILPVVCPIISETQVQSEFAKQIREAQEGNLEIVKIKEQLSNLKKAPPPVCLIYELMMA